MAERRSPKPTKLDTRRQRAAYLFVCEYIRISNAYCRPAPMDFRVQEFRKAYREEVARAVADEQQKRRVA